MKRTALILLALVCVLSTAVLLLLNPHVGFEPSRGSVAEPQQRPFELQAQSNRASVSVSDGHEDSAKAGSDGDSSDANGMRDPLDDSSEAPPSPTDSLDVARRKLIKRMIREAQTAAPSDPGRLAKLRTALSLSIATIMDKSGTSVAIPSGEKFHTGLHSDQQGFVNSGHYYKFRSAEFPEYKAALEFVAPTASDSGDNAGATGGHMEFEELVELVKYRALSAVSLISESK
ncbi:MAG: hypothetical protein IPJ19_16105 [Planctomycetes bacterium]|nr:hypothetical protein [Planctomycetota bacterium]